MFNKLDDYFTDRRKLTAAIGAVAFALLWMVLWNAFPMQFYVMFFSSAVGSNIQLALLNIVVLLPLFWIFTKLTASDLSFCKTVLINIFLVAAVEYVFSIFMFLGYFYWCVIAYIIHAALNIPIFGSAEVRENKNGKGMRAPEAKREKAIKKYPLIPIMWAVAFTFTADAVCILLMYVIARIYAY